MVRRTRPGVQSLVFAVLRSGIVGWLWPLQAFTGVLQTAQGQTSPPAVTSYDVAPIASPGARRNASIEAAQRFIASGAADDAVVVLRPLVEENPEDAEACLLLGTALALVPKRAEAIEVLRRAVLLQPDSAQARLTLGMALSRFGEVAAARQAYEEAIALDPRLSKAHTNLAMLLAAQKELDSAIVHFSRAIEAEGESAVAAQDYYLRGKVYSQQGLLESAEKDFERAIQLRPDHAKAYLELGVVRNVLRNGKGATEAFERTLELSPEDGEARYQLGLRYLRDGRTEDAAKQLRIALRLRPEDQEVVYALARALRVSGRPDEAKPLMERMLEAAKGQALHDPGVLRAGELNNAGLELEKKGRFAEALEKYREALELSPHEVVIRRNLALVLCRLERWNEAVTELRVVLEKWPGDADATKALYIALEGMHDNR